MTREPQSKADSYNNYRFYSNNNNGSSSSTGSYRKRSYSEEWDTNYPRSAKMLKQYPSPSVPSLDSVLNDSKFMSQMPSPVPQVNPSSLMVNQQVFSRSLPTPQQESDLAIGRSYNCANTFHNTCNSNIPRSKSMPGTGTGPSLNLEPTDYFSHSNISSYPASANANANATGSCQQPQYYSAMSMSGYTSHVSSTVPQPYGNYNNYPLMQQQQQQMQPSLFQDYTHNVNGCATPYSLIGTNPRYKLNTRGTRLRCQRCGVTETPEWRRGPNGARTLCNACGLFHAKLVKKKGKEAAKAIILGQQRQQYSDTGLNTCGGIRRISGNIISENIIGVDDLNGVKRQRRSRRNIF